MDKRMDKRMDKSWMEPVLERHLGPVPAPEELWDRVRGPRRKTAVFGWKLAFAAMLVVATGWALHPRGVSIESERAGEIREWVRARTGLDVPLAASARVCGGRVVGGSAEIRYRVRDREAILLVAKAERFTAGHEFVSRSSWILRGQSYTVSAADLQTACVLCHEE